MILSKNQPKEILSILFKERMNLVSTNFFIHEFEEQKNLTNPTYENNTKSPRLILLKIRKFAKLHLTPSYWLFEEDFLHVKF